MSSDRFGLELQLLKSAADKVLLLGDLGARGSETGRFTSAGLKAAFLSLDVPPPGNVSQVLSDLRKKDLVISHGTSDWALTPLGRKRVQELGSTDVQAFEKLAEGLPQAQFAHVQHTVIPTYAAPPRWRVGIDRFLEDNPFDENVFIMTRFGSEGDPSDPVNRAVEVVREVVSAYGLRAHLATDRQVDDDLLGNVGAYMWGCQYGIGIVENIESKGLNNNVLIEMGGMIVTGRRCAILKDKTAASLPTDLSGQIYKSVDLQDVSTVEARVRGWVASDLAIAAIDGE